MTIADAPYKGSFLFENIIYRSLFVTSSIFSYLHFKFRMRIYRVRKKFKPLGIAHILLYSSTKICYFQNSSYSVEEMFTHRGFLF